MLVGTAADTTRWSRVAVATQSARTTRSSVSNQQVLKRSASDRVAARCSTYGVFSHIGKVLLVHLISRISRRGTENSLKSTGFSGVERKRWIRTHRRHGTMQKCDRVHIRHGWLVAAHSRPRRSARRRLHRGRNQADITRVIIGRAETTCWMVACWEMLRLGKSKFFAKLNLLADRRVVGEYFQEQVAACDESPMGFRQPSRLGPRWFSQRGACGRNGNDRSGNNYELP